MRTIKNKNRKNEPLKKCEIKIYHFEEEAGEGSNLRELIFIPNRKIMIVKMMRLR